MNNPFETIDARLNSIETLLLNMSLSQTQKMETHPVKKFIDVAAASEFLGVARQTIYGLVSDGKIPYYKQGKLLRFSTEELERWIEQGRRVKILAEDDTPVLIHKKK